MAVSVVLTPTATPAPTILVEAFGLDETAVSARVDRLVGASDEPVTESLTVLPSGGMLVVVDYEPPIARPVTYRVSTFGADGAPLDAVLTEAVQTPDIDINAAWVMDGLDPAGAVLVDLMDGTEQGTTLGTAGFGLLVPVTGGLPVAALGARSHTGRNYIKKVEGYEQLEAFEGLVGHGGVLVVRPSPLARLPHPTGIIRLAADTVTRTDWVPWREEAEYVVPGVEVQADSWPHMVPLYTWADMAEALPGMTWADYADAHPGMTWHDLAARGW